MLLNGGLDHRDGSEAYVGWNMSVLCGSLLLLSCSSRARILEAQAEAS